MLEDKGGRVLCGVHSGQVQFTVNTLAGVSQRSRMSICVWVWKPPRLFHEVQFGGKNEKKKKNSLVLDNELFVK